MHFVLPIAGKGDSDWAYSWIPVVGPIIGGIIGARCRDAGLRPVGPGREPTGIDAQATPT